jgi:hypothetical protein
MSLLLQLRHFRKCGSYSQVSPEMMQTAQQEMTGTAQMYINYGIYQVTDWIYWFTLLAAILQFLLRGNWRRSIIKPIHSNFVANHYAVNVECLCWVLRLSMIPTGQLQSFSPWFRLLLYRNANANSVWRTLWQIAISVTLLLVASLCRLVCCKVYRDTVTARSQLGVRCIAGWK